MRQPRHPRNSRLTRGFHHDRATAARRPLRARRSPRPRRHGRGLRGRDIRLGRDVAVKTLRADLARDPTFQARFRREAQSAASLNHPSIVAVYDTGEDYIDGIAVPYIVMEYVDGRTLRDLLKTRAAAAAGARAGDHRRGAAGAGLQPPQRHRAPRHQAGQRDAHPRRRRQGDGLRHRPGGGATPGRR